MRKATLLKLVLALGLGAASVVGLLPTTADSAHAALLCPFQLDGCTRTGYQIIGDYKCCTYHCPSGQQIVGPCEHM